MEPEDNPRIAALKNVLYGLDDKVLIWCKYTHEIKDVAQCLSEWYGDWSTVALYGEMTIRQRNKSLDDFEKDARFLVGNKGCGGYGLNLQFCHNVVFYNNDFDWARRAQAEDRVHRIGQEHDVNIISLYAQGSIDEMVLKNLARKTNLVSEFRDEVNSVKDKRTFLKNLLKGVRDVGKDLSA
jgi:SNF2 family DNA or RNA helicase